MDVLPDIPQDNTDRNRTSPMAFTGNKFEFRMLGSSQSIAGPNIVLNAMMAESLSQYADRLEKSDDFMSDLNALIKEVFTAHKRILFDGNGYDDAWIEEAERRGLSNLKSTADALKAYTDDKNEALLIKHGVYIEEEMEARGRIHVENYTAIINIEGRTMVDMINKDILPAVSEYAAELCARVQTKQAVGAAAGYEEITAKKIGTLTDELLVASEKLNSDLESIPEDEVEAMKFCHDVIIADMDKARDAADQLELLTDNAYWPFPTYSDLLFSER